MKNTKRILSLVLTIATLIFALASCAGGGLVAEKGTVKLVIENGEKAYTVYEIDLAKLEDREGGAVALLEYARVNCGLEYKTDDAGYGAYITEIGSIKQDYTTGEYIILYTTETADFAVPTADMPVVPTVDYGEVLLTSAGVGLSSMHVSDGTVILFRLESYK